MSKERDLERESQNHLDLEAEEFGRQAAKRRFGNPMLIKEDVRAAWGWTFPPRALARHVRPPQSPVLRRQATHQ